MGARAFSRCERLGTIYVEDGCGCYLSRADVPVSARIVFPQETAVSGVPLSRLRELKKVVVPEGVEKIESDWFQGSEIESVTIPSSVKEICTSAFCNCEKLRHMAFAPRSELEKIEFKSFRQTGIEVIIVPKSVKEI